MEFNERKLKGAFEISGKAFFDDRGFFMRTFDDILFSAAGLKFNWVQENHSKTIKKNTIRGLHFQLPPFAETKLIRCLQGAILDVFVDLRKDSPTFGQWDSILLSDENFKMVLLPRGFAHGYCTISNNSQIFYKVDNYYSSIHESGIIWNDPHLNIRWNCDNPILSEKDKKSLTFKDFIQKHQAIEI